ncbi:MAG: hypothetical protein ACI4QS_09070, partial [Comamonas sp.]
MKKPTSAWTKGKKNRCGSRPAVFFVAATSVCLKQTAPKTQQAAQGYYGTYKVQSANHQQQQLLAQAIWLGQPLRHQPILKEQGRQQATNYINKSG